MSEAASTSGKQRGKFRWSLRTTLIVVTLIGGWLGYAMNWKQQRQAFLARPAVCEFNDTPPSVINRWNNRLPVFAPLGLWLLGERGVVSVWISQEIWSAERQANAERLFPEARIMKLERGRWVSVRPAESKLVPWTDWMPRDPALVALGVTGFLMVSRKVWHSHLRKRMTDRQSPSGLAQPL